MRIDSAIITGSFSVNGDTFNDLGAYTTTGSNTFIGDQSIVGAVSASALTGSISYTNLTSVPTLVSGSSQIVGILSSLNSFTASNSTTNTFTSSATARLNALETTSASVDTLNTIQNTRLTNLENKTGSLATTGSNTFIGTQVITGSLYVTTDLIVQGSSSIQNITGSSVNIGTNKVILNTANPAVRYAGISVIDSGSTGLTGSILWDSTNNNWLYQNPSGSSYTSAKFIAGPQSAALGSEPGLVTNYIQKAVGDDHISSSAIYDDGTTIGLKSNTEITGSFKIKGSQLIDATNTGTSYIDGTITIVGPSPISFVTSANLNPSLNRWGIKLRGTTDGDFSIYDYTNSAHRLSIDSSGRIGIGITNPSTTFNVSHPSHGVGISYMGSSSLPAIAGLYTGDGSLGGSGYGDLYIKARTDYGGFYNIMLHTAASNNTSVERMRITHSGLVGIGTTNPSFQLHVSSSADALFVGANGASQTAQFKNSSANPVILRLMNNNGNFYDIQTNPSDNSFTIDYTDTEKFRIMNSGYVGIGNSNPQAKLDLGTSYSGGTYRNAFFLYNDNNSGPYYGTKNGFYMDQFSLSNNTTLSFSTATAAPGTLYFASKNTDVNDSSSLTPRMVIVGQTGNVGIGMTNPSHKLQIQGNLNLSGSGLMRTYFAQSYSLGSQFDIFRFLNDNGSVFAQGGISGLLFLSAQDTNTGGNQICYTFHLQTNGNGTAQANITQMSYQLRGTQPIQSIGLQNDGSGGAVKVVGSVVGSGVGGCNVWATFVGVAV